MATIIGKERIAKQERLDSIIAKATPDQAAQWVENNVTDLSSAKQALKIIARLLVAMNTKIIEGES